MEPFRVMCVVHVFLIRNGEILLLRRKNTGHHDGSMDCPPGSLMAASRFMPPPSVRSGKNAALLLLPQILP